jgi:hypothetical protein
MRKLLVALCCLSLGTANLTTAQTKTDNVKPKVDGPQFKFEGGDVHDFGVLQRGPIANHTFEFTNVGTRPINVMNVTPSCGCTGVEWIKTPVPPGGKGWIKLGLKTEEQHGVFNKEVYIQSDAITPHGEKRYTLYIKGDARDDVKKSNEKK